MNYIVQNSFKSLYRLVFVKVFHINIELNMKVVPFYELFRMKAYCTEMNMI